MQQHTLTTHTTLDLSKGNLVWAKTEGHPWWPALISKLPTKRYPYFMVDFLGDSSYAFVPESMMKPFQDFSDADEKESKSDKALLRAVEEARKIYALDAESRKDVVTYCESMTSKILLESEISKNQEAILKHSDELNASEKEVEEKIEEEEKESDENECIETSCFEEKSKYVRKLIKKYKLNGIHKLKEKFEAKKAVKMEKIPKRKLIHKNFDADSHTELSKSTLLARKINHLLRLKGEFSSNQTHKISLSLCQQLLELCCYCREDFMRLAKWISFSKTTTILSYYENWSSLSPREKEKSSTMTVEE